MAVIKKIFGLKMNVAIRISYQNQTDFVRCNPSFGPTKVLHFRRGNSL